ncbi:hypothetical protein chiPu_0021521 [Chiloscyllium punctatum]|uniref:Uncharacterized protein n=1 Tax=Chiloscyllium punctatum TaxID=137246 RepID=A0A401RGS2_CHIPU|nr:hypothetical protein [Chiloscyllium punctatum]
MKLEVGYIRCGHLSLSPPSETEAISPELQTVLNGSSEDVNITDPALAAFVRRQRRQEAYERKKNATLAERFVRFAQKKHQTFRRSILMTGYAIRNLLFGRPPMEQLMEELEFANMKLYESTDPEAQRKAWPKVEDHAEL